MATRVLTEQRGVHLSQRRVIQPQIKPNVFKRTFSEYLFDIFASIGSFFKRSSNPDIAAHQAARDKLKKSIHLEIFGTLKNISFPEQMASGQLTADYLLQELKMHTESSDLTDKGHQRARLHGAIIAAIKDQEHAPILADKLMVLDTKELLELFGAKFLSHNVNDQIDLVGDLLKEKGHPLDFIDTLNLRIILEDGSLVREIQNNHPRAHLHRKLERLVIGEFVNKNQLTTKEALGLVKDPMFSAMIQDAAEIYYENDHTTLRGAKKTLKEKWEQLSLEIESSGIVVNVVPLFFSEFFDVRKPVNFASLISRVEEECALKTTVKAAALDFSAKVKSLKTLLKSEVQEDLTKHAVHRAMGMLYQIFDSPVYKTLKEDEGNPLIAYLHDVAEEFYFNMGGVTDFAEYTEEIASQAAKRGLEVPHLNATMKEGALRIRSIYQHTKDTYFTKKNLSGKLSYHLLHLNRSKGSLLGAFAGGTFDPFMKGNHTLTSGIYKTERGEQEHIVVHTYAPSIVLDNRVNPIAYAMMQRLQNRSMHCPKDPWVSYRNPISGMTHLEISTLQAMTRHNRGEKARTEITFNLQKIFPGVVTVQGWDYNHDHFKGKLPQKVMNELSISLPKDEENQKQSEVRSLENYFRSVLLYNVPLKKERMEDLGIYFPHLVDQDIGSAINGASAIYSSVDPDQWFKLTPARRAQVYAHTIAAFLDMLSQRKLNEQYPHMGKIQACKQNIDRGAVANSMAKILHITKMMSQEGADLHDLRSLRQQVAEEAVFARAPSVDDRGIIEKRFNVLTDFMGLIGSLQVEDPDLRFAAIINEVLDEEESPTVDTYEAFEQLVHI